MAPGSYGAGMSGEIKSRRSSRSRWIEYTITIVVAVLVAVGVRTFLVQSFYIPSESMEQTLLVDDQVLVNKVIYRLRDPGRGEVVVFKPPAEWAVETGKDDYIKRIVGIGGDRVICCDDKQRITVNGKPLDEDYLFPGNQPSETPFDVIVPPGRVFVLGDHRNESADSRFHQDFERGTVPVDRIVGRAFVSFWPVARAKVLSPPETYTGIPAPR